MLDVSYHHLISCTSLSMHLPMLLVWEIQRLHFPDSREARILDARKFHLSELMAQGLEGGSEVVTVCLLLLVLVVSKVR